MFDVFISYPRIHRAKVELINQMLRAAGFKTFFDIEDIDAGDEFPDKVNEAVRTARCILGCWSKLAFDRAWVRRECRIGQLRGVLVPIAIEKFSDLDMHVQFVDTNYFDLTDFTGQPDHPGWRRTLAAINRHANLRVEPKVPTDGATSSNGTEIARKWLKDAANKRPPLYCVGGLEPTTHLPKIPVDADQEFIANNISEIDIPGMDDSPPKPDIYYFFPNIGERYTVDSKVVLDDASPKTGIIKRCILPGWFGLYYEDNVGQCYPLVMLDGVANEHSRRRGQI